ncbi:hypothetical protein BVX94_00750 [bacterium B17]|nr:hypothetical protein BVX94_00750 [bacterium B17]
MNTVLITGGTRGIGAAIAHAFENAGANLLLTGTDPEQIKTLNAEAPETRRYIAADFKDHASTQSLVEEINSMDRLDVCINNAGINIIKSVYEASADDFQRVTDVNYRAPYLICQAAAKKMRENKYGRVVNIASIWSVVTKPGRSMYASAKTGLVGMTRALATDLAPDGILVNCVSPGFTLTDLTRESLSQKEIDEIGKQIPCKRMAEPSEIAKVVAFLASPENTYLTGQNIVVDGGFSHV